MVRQSYFVAPEMYFNLTQGEWPCMQNTPISSIQPKTGNFRSNFTQKNRPNTNSTSRPKGKSKYAKKARGNAKKAPVAAKPRGPVYTYTSECHGAPATKKACSATNKKDALLQGLGKFRCTECKKRCKVKVSKLVEKEAANVNPGLDQQASGVPQSS